MYLNTPIVAENEEEIELFENYIAKAGPMLDGVSDKQHFSVVVPQKAVRCPVLYYACLACSARTLCRDVEEVYSVKCYRLLIKLLENPECVADEVLLATTVILRMKEQFLDLWEDSQHHLKGCFSIIVPEKQFRFSPDIGLGEASFWTYVREDLRMAVLHRRKCIFTKDSPITFSPGSECMWTNIITYITVKMVNWAFGEKDYEEGKRLNDFLDEWFRRKPNTFDPIGSSLKSHPIPRVTFVCSWHNYAYQYYYFGKLLYASVINTLADCDPLLSNTVLETDILQPSRILLGIVAYTKSHACQINGSHLAAYGGQYLVKEEERELLINFLTDLNKETGWPCQATCESLHTTWQNQNHLFRNNLSPQPLQTKPNSPSTY
ncbi:hypothetical protein TRICI_003953 [Trichomonascus ciferrii]|uniref:Uncharacterized protein n=1 Tax=Trichomonascus ciferrii TaxID=44093 RepID=A0A642V2B9_9ASCO|nr:hypothetical protein TRICI_003953 [Trichomonascus ciferrii]